MSNKSSYYANERVYTPPYVKDFDNRGSIDLVKPFSDNKTNLLSLKDSIRQSLQVILSTREGTRFFLPGFGTRLYGLLYDSNDFSLKDKLDIEIRRCVGIWEKRVTIISLDIYINRSEVKVAIGYMIDSLSVSDTYEHVLDREV